MNNGLAVAIHAARMFGLCEDFKRGNNCYYNLDNMLIIYANNPYRYYLKYTNADFIGSSQEFTNKLSSIMQHYIYCYDLNDDTVYVTFFNVSNIDIWRFDGLKYINVLGMVSPLIEHCVTDVSTHTFYKLSLT